MREVERSLKGNQKAFAEEKARLVAHLQEQKQKLGETEATLKKERELYIDDKKELQSVIVAERVRLEEAEKFLKEAEQLYTDIEKDLSEKLKVERDRVAELSARLEAERAEFAELKQQLSERLGSQEAQVKELQEALERERMEAARERERLTRMLDDERRISRLKKRQMNDRFSAIRAEMTQLWQGALRDGRKQVQELKKKYEKEVQVLEASVADLQSDLQNAVAENESLTTLLADMTKQKESILKAKEAAELQLKAKDQEIGTLKSNLHDLKEESTELRGSARSLLRATVSLTTKRVGRVFQRKKRRKN